MLEIDLSNAAKDFFYEQYSAQLSNAGNDCDKLDVLYENIPPFVVERLNKEQRWQSLKSLLGCVVDDGSSLVGGTDEEEAVINLLKSYYTEWNWLYNKLYSDKQVVYQLYEKVDGDNLLAVMEVMRQCADESGKDESGTSKYIYIGNAGEAYRGNTFLYGYPYVLTEQSGWSKAYDINLHSVIGSPNTSLSVEVRQQASDVENIHPLDRIKVYKDEPGNMELLPAVYAYYLGTRQNRQELLSAIGKTANVLATITASRVLFSAGSGATIRVLAALQLAKTGLDIAMADKEVQAALDKTEEGKWFKQKWPIISITTDVTLLGADIISGLAKNGSRAAADIEKIKNGKYKDAADELEKIAEEAGAVNAAKATGKALVKSWDEAVKAVDDLIKPQINKLKTIYPNAKMGYRGSLATGKKYSTGKPFDPADWDVDAFIVSDDIYKKLPAGWKDGRDIPAINNIADELEKEFVKISGYRTEVGKPFTFKVWTTEQFEKTIKPGGYKLFE